MEGGGQSSKGWAPRGVEGVGGEGSSAVLLGRGAAASTAADTCEGGGRSSGRGAPRGVEGVGEDAASAAGDRDDVEGGRAVAVPGTSWCFRGGGSRRSEESAATEEGGRTAEGGDEDEAAAPETLGGEPPFGETGSEPDPEQEGGELISNQ